MKGLLCVSAVIFLTGCAAHTQTTRPSHEDAVRAAEAALDNAGDTIFAASGFVWHSAENGTSVQFGIPETDERAFRLDCDNGRLFVIAPANTNEPEGSSTAAVFANGDRRPGKITYLGDGPNFVVSVAPTDPVVATLLTDRRISINTPDAVVSLPGAGGLPLLRSLIERCRSQ